MLVRVFLAVIVVVSLAVFVSSVMRYNELREEQEDLEQTRAELIDEKEELVELSESKGTEKFVVKMARRFWNLFFPDEEVYYNDRNS
jgi:predicted nuclease with TOPRIM domain